MNQWTSTFGVFAVDLNAGGICSVSLVDESLVLDPIADDVAQRLDAFCGGDPTSISLDLGSVKSELARLTLAALLEIPRGEVRSYAWVAKEIGNPRAIRPVASAVARNPIPVLVPCHRVVRSDGFIGNFSLGGPAVKRRLLEAEGVDVDGIEALARRDVRFLADKESNIFHLPTCKHVSTLDSALRIELKRVIADADAAMYDACSRCRPI